MAAEVRDRFPAVQDLFSIRDLGGWPEAIRTLFAPDGVYERVMASLRAAP